MIMREIEKNLITRDSRLPNWGPASMDGPIFEEGRLLKKSENVRGCEGGALGQSQRERPMRVKEGPGNSGSYRDAEDGILD
jgi:hypothetical protein